MAIKYQFNKTSLHELNKQLRIRLRALPTLKNKESALRAEVKRQKIRLRSWTMLFTKGPRIRLHGKTLGRVRAQPC